MYFFEKSLQIPCRVKEKLYLCTVKIEMTLMTVDFGLWCNGNTTDSGPVFLGSNPSSPTSKA